MDEILGGSIGVFIGLTVILFGGFAFLTGQAMANAWRSVGPVIGYTLLLTAGNRFLAYALFEGNLLSIAGFLIDFAVLFPIALAGYWLTKARKMVSQYPWLYERSGLFGWRERSPSTGVSS